MKTTDAYRMPDENGHFGKFGGRFVPETLMKAVLELEEEYNKAIVDADFCDELKVLMKDYVGRETPLYLAENLPATATGDTTREQGARGVTARSSAERS